MDLASADLRAFLRRLGWVGREIFVHAPPIPTQVVSSDGQVLFSEGQVQQGQQSWLSAGGQQLGSVWGHGSYLAPDWAADWLHREALALQAIWAKRDFGAAYEHLQPGQKAQLDAQLKTELRPQYLRRCQRLDQPECRSGYRSRAGGEALRRPLWWRVYARCIA
ncbi:hypothetical protein [Candidatus Accumulibacter sp. ACC012]|uniref:hypothetical protein n=1 Tax=Candidatus Accumulibacter sp. ACC012 TaxID=2823332 RepID=UPI00342ACBBB